MPLPWFIAVHVLNQPGPILGAKQRLHFFGQTHHLSWRPLWQHARMHHEDAVFPSSQALVTKPIHQFQSVGCIEHVLDGVTALEGFEAEVHRQQMQIVIAQQAGKTRFVCTQATQQADIVWASIHQVPQ